MSLSDQFFFSIFNHYKKNKNRKIALRIALLYINAFQVSALLAFGMFLYVFLNQMNVVFMSSSKASTLFIIVSLLICFKNWIQYSGKKLNVLNAKFSTSKTKKHPILLVWSLPLVFIVIAIILSKAF